MLQQDSKPTIYDSKITNNTNKWLVVNDGVMGGLSKSNISVGENGIVLFKGSVTTENNGGFASVYYSFASKNISSFSHIVLRIKGDIKEYQFRIREEQKQSHWYIKTF